MKPKLLPPPEPEKEPIDAAIEKVQPPDQREIKTTKFSLRLATGNPAMIEMPDDATDSDWLALIGTIMTQVRPALTQMRLARNPASHLVSPIGTPLVRN